MHMMANFRNWRYLHLPAIACSRPCGASQALAAPDFTKLLHGIRLDSAEREKLFFCGQTDMQRFRRIVRQRHGIRVAASTPAADFRAAGGDLQLDGS